MSDQRHRDRGQSPEMTRRQFVQVAAAAGVGLTLGRSAMAQAGGTASAGGGEALPIALIGAGSQGRNLLHQTLKIPGVRFVAVCDIWPYSQKYASNILRAFKQQVNVYSDYREMLEKEKSLAAVIVASPDWMHAEHTVACLKAGVHVYCEKEMSNTLEGAAQIVQTAEQTGKVVQIGHQRRSNPLYAHALKMLYNDRICGRITNVYGQWNRARGLEPLLWPEKETIADDVLKAHGYDSMMQFRNWRWYRKFSGGTIADLGSHQVDVFNWFLKANPKAVLASGGRDYYVKDREWYDTILAIYEYATAAGPVRGCYQVLNTTSYGDYYEVFMGDEGTLVISEDPRKGMIFRELQAKTREWENEAERVATMGKDAIALKIGETLDPSGKPTAEGRQLLEQSKKPPHQLHLENFFAAVRAGKPDSVTCGPRVAYETAVSVLRVNQSVESGRRMEFAADDFDSTARAKA